MAEEGKQIPIEWRIPEDVPTYYANNFAIQHTESEFVIYFFEVFSPLILGEPEEVQRKMEAIESVPARCVARVVVSPPKLEMLIGALVQNHTRFVSKFAPGEQDAS